MLKFGRLLVQSQGKAIVSNSANILLKNKNICSKQDCNDGLLTLWKRTCCVNAGGTGIVQAKVQQPAPDFQCKAVVNNEFKNVKLSDFSGKYLVLFFYPLDFTFVCPTEIIAFSDRISEFNAINTNVVGCSCDSHFTHLAWINTPRKQGGLGEIKYPLLADFHKTVAKSYGVLLENEGIPLRGLFIIDPKGTLRQITINDLPVGRSVDEVLRLVKAFQFVDEHGEVCPANWQPDSPTIKPSPVASKEYFGKVNK